MKWRRTDRIRTFPGITQIEPYQAVVHQITQVLRENAPSLPGARVEGPGKDAREPEFYVVTLRLPGDDQGPRQPMTLFHILSPDWFSPAPVGEVVRIVAIGYSAATISVRRFLRTWHEGRIGGEVIYEGDLTDQAIGDYTLQALQRFLSQRDGITAKNGIGTISVWPLTADFRPRLCSFCLLPAAQGVCPKCGIPAVPGGTGRRLRR